MKKREWNWIHLLKRLPIRSTNLAACEGWARSSPLGSCSVLPVWLEFQQKREWSDTSQIQKVYLFGCGVCHWFLKGKRTKCTLEGIKQRTYSQKLVGLRVTLHPTLPRMRNKRVLTNVLPSPNILLAVTLRQNYFTFLCLSFAICRVRVIVHGNYFRVVVQMKHTNICENT